MTVRSKPFGTCWTITTKAAYRILISMAALLPLGLSESEEDDLVAFLATLTSPEYAGVSNEELEKQRARSKTDRPQRDEAAAMGKAGLGPGFKGPFGDMTPAQNEENPASLGGD